MKDYHFFAAMPEERGSKSASKRYPFQPWTRATVREIVARGGFVDCVAVCTDTRGHISNGTWIRDAVAGIFSVENSACTFTGVAADWLRKRCVRIDEPTARKAHPALFEYLDQ